MKSTIHGLLPLTWTPQRSGNSGTLRDFRTRDLAEIQHQKAGYNAVLPRSKTDQSGKKAKTALWYIFLPLIMSSLVLALFQF